MKKLFRFTNKGLCSFVGQSNTHMYIFSQEFTASEGQRTLVYFHTSLGSLNGVEWSGVEWSRNTPFGVVSH